MGHDTHAIDVLVVGAGPTGLTMAAELARHGVRCRIVDKAPAASDRSKAVAVHARSLEVFEAMGLIDGVLQAGIRLHGVSIHANGRRVARLTLDGLDAPYPFVLSLPQSDTERLLVEHAARLGVTVERSTELSSLHQDEASVTAVLRRAGGEEERVEARWLVGCDGSHSAVRKALGLEFSGEQYEEQMALADVRIEWPLPTDELHAFLSTKGLLFAAPMPHGRWRLFLSTSQEPTLERVQALVDARSPVKAVIRDPAWLAQFRIHRRQVTSYRVGRAFLAGDAAHVHSPAGGQGMNTGIQDAYNLAWKLALAVRGEAAPGLLDSYHRERHPIAAATLRGTDLATRMIGLRNPAAQQIRNQLVSTLTSLGVVQKRMRSTVSELSLNYRQSPIVDEHRGVVPGLLAVARGAAERGGKHPSLRDVIEAVAGPRAGDRAPDASLTGITTGSGEPTPDRLFPLLRGTRHTLLLFSGASPTAERFASLERAAHEVVSRLGALVAVHVVAFAAARPPELAWEGSLLLDRAGTLHGRYGVSAGGVYGIRPDGYIGFRSQEADPDLLVAHFRRIFSHA